MDPMSTVALAGKVLEATTFAIKVASRTAELAGSGDGRTKSSIEIETALDDLDNILNTLIEENALKSPVGKLEQHRGWALQKLTFEVQQIGGNLRKVISTFRPKGRPNFWKNVVGAFRATWKEPELQQLQNKLESIQQRVLLCLTVEQRQHLHHIMLVQRDTLESQESIQHKLGLITTHFEDQTLQEPQNDDHEDFLQTLYDMRMNSRMESVHMAHGDTFEWILDKENSRQTADQSFPGRMRLVLGRLGLDRSTPYVPHTQTELDLEASLGANANILDWLQGQDKLFWIHGKPGCGKSTVMKFLLQHKLLKPALEQWTGPNRSMVLSHFLWAAGTESQRSRQGLLKSLLFQFLENQRDLIPVIFTRMDRDAAIKANKMASSSSADIWPVEKLEEACFKLLGHTKMKTLILIDGLDEFQGQPAHIAELVIKLAAQEHVKVLVAGRRLPQHTKAFSEYPQLAMHDLTWTDIAVYVIDRCRENEYFGFLLARHSYKSLGIVFDILNRAAGVFLWVKIMVDSLISGCDAFEDLEDLRQRLSEMPDDLEKLYQCLLTALEPRYYSQAIRWLRTVQVSLAKCDNASPSLGELQLCSRYTQEVDWITLVCRKDLGLFEQECGLLRKQIEMRCSQFLVIKQMPRQRHGFESSVELLHRSVIDFLESEAFLAANNLPLPFSNDELRQSILAARTAVRILSLKACYSSDKGYRGSNFPRETISSCMASEKEFRDRAICVKSQMHHYLREDDFFLWFPDPHQFQDRIYQSILHAILKKDWPPRLRRHPDNRDILALKPFLLRGDLEFVAHQLELQGTKLKTNEAFWILSYCFVQLYSINNIHGRVTNPPDQFRIHLSRLAKLLFPPSGTIPMANLWMRFFFQYRSVYDLFFEEFGPHDFIEQITAAVVQVLLESGAQPQECGLIDMHQMSCWRTQMSMVAYLRESKTTKHDEDLQIQVADQLEDAGVEHIVRRQRRWSLPVNEQSKAFAEETHCPNGYEMGASSLYALLIMHCGFEDGLRRLFANMVEDTVSYQPFSRLQRRNSFSRLKTNRAFEDEEICGTERTAWADLQHVLLQRHDFAHPADYRSFVTSTSTDIDV